VKAIVESVVKRRTKWSVAVRVALTLADAEDGPDVYRLAGQLVDVRFMPVPQAPLLPMSPEEVADLRARLKAHNDHARDPATTGPAEPVDAGAE
jgi:hypothetical protein